MHSAVGYMLWRSGVCLSVRLYRPRVRRSVMGRGRCSIETAECTIMQLIPAQKILVNKVYTRNETGAANTSQKKHETGR